MNSNKINVMITGASGQLGQCLQKLDGNYHNLNLCFYESEKLDITNKINLKVIFESKSFDYIINCAAYTNVELAEKETEKAYLINAEGVKNLAEICEMNNATLIHISTDYVFDGQKKSPYLEEDATRPINEYGKSKLLGEKYIKEIVNRYFIIRTSWLYSSYGNNFYNTILKKAKIVNELSIVSSERGTPTNANDLAGFILQLISHKNMIHGLYHYSNLGEASWYDFAKEILRLEGKLDSIKLEKTDNYPTFAERPKYSVLDKKKCLDLPDVCILNWKESLRILMNNRQ
ncbi:dTDP-4-dehydrorhamnose reductase [Aquimarina addita]|uniref:dTDP-4-dehydrorhamnose reductase n=2 Tax=Aquimarina addita TaxID=870485 RepID=A0ABP7XAQ9_9FLAO